MTDSMPDIGCHASFLLSNGTGWPLEDSVSVVILGSLLDKP